MSQEPIALEGKRIADDERIRNEEAQRVAQARYNEIATKRKQLHGTLSTDAAWSEYQAVKREKMKLTKTIAKLNDIKARGEAPRFTAEGIKIMWKEPLDAEFAVTWPAAVVHDELSFRENRYGEKHDAPSLSYHVWSRDGSQPDAIEEGILQDIPPTETRTPEVKVPPSRMQRIIDRIRIGRKTPV